MSPRLRLSEVAPSFRVQLGSVLRRTELWLGLCAAAVLALLSTCSPQRSALDEIRATGVLRVATINSPTTYYQGPAGEPTGFEYDLVQGLAEELGVRVELEVATNPQQALALVRSGRAHLAAASIGITPSRRELVRFSSPLMEVVPALVYRRGQPHPKHLNDLKGELRLVQGSVHAERLKALAPRFPKLRWEETSEEEVEDLLFNVAEGRLDYTIANSDLIAINQRYYPSLRIAFKMGETTDIAWAFSKFRDDSLPNAVEEYLRGLDKAEFARLKDRYFGHIEQVDTHGAMTLATHVETRLPKYRPHFETAALEHGLDWRLLAAIGYQESHWDPSAISPTGVRGIMQLTNATAAFLNVGNREDPAQSIRGGSRYFARLREQLPESIKEPDRTWMALAAYNIGLGHLYDARRLTEQLGGNPNRWIDVRKRLPLLTQSKWHTRTRHGYARGRQAVIYVGNVRTYYDMLIWVTGGTPLPEEGEESGDAPATEQPKTKDPLDINLPVL